MGKLTQRYNRLQITLHWLMALMIIGGLVMGLVIEDMPLSPLKLKMLSWHKWNGITVLWLALLRLGVRHLSGAPGLPASMPGWQKLAAEWGHRMLYLLMLLIPLSGWLMSSAKGFPVKYFGVLPLPDFVSPDKALAELIKPWHEIAAFGLAALVALHVAAALKHQFIDRDGLLDRMRPAR